MDAKEEATRDGRAPTLRFTHVTCGAPLGLQRHCGVVRTVNEDALKPHRMLPGRTAVCGDVRGTDQKIRDTATVFNQRRISCVLSGSKRDGE
ncbi:hypothetical protein RRG08_002298 [Elysia crispata]|uniref:Uncharacterized protein n=1 Tax=Elysia crispata TaxID=231223 RepID=A0AAE0ZCA6_9GAST|nr:hypothetical protein RRG08_002298 [Elysia crispata]